MVSTAWSRRLGASGQLAARTLCVATSTAATAVLGVAMPYEMTPGRPPRPASRARHALAVAVEDRVVAVADQPAELLFFSLSTISLVFSVSLSVSAKISSSSAAFIVESLETHAPALVQPQVACGTGRMCVSRTPSAESEIITPENARPSPRDSALRRNPIRTTQTAIPSAKPGSNRVIRHPTGLARTCVVKRRTSGSTASRSSRQRDESSAGKGRATREQSRARWSWRAGSGVWTGAALVGAPRRRGAMAAVVVDLAASAAVGPIFAPLGCSLGSRTARRMRTATAHDVARTRARQGHSQGCCGAGRTRRGARGSHKRDVGARTRARPRERERAARQRGAESTQNGTHT